MKPKKWVEITSKILLLIGFIIAFGVAGNCDTNPTYPLYKVIVYMNIALVLILQNVVIGCESEGL